MKVLVPVLFAILSFFTQASTPAGCAGQANVQANGALQDEGYVTIGGIEQWIAIRAQNCANPLLLIVHGGPGSTSSHYTNAHFQALEKHFIVVHWDQRGSGKTFARALANTPFDDYLVENPLSVQQLVTDGIEVSNYLLQRFGRKKLILRGGSWGAYLSMNMLQAAPELFSAYVGHAQLVNANEKLQFGYQKSLELAKASNDTDIQAMLKALTPPPYQHPRDYGKLVRIIKHFEARHATPSTQTSQVIDGYDSEQDQKHRYMADDYSWMHFVGFERLGIQGMQDTVDLEKLEASFQMPLFILQGGQDLTTPAHLTARYIDKIKAPVKEFIRIDDAGHEPNDKMLSTELALLIERVTPLAQTAEKPAASR